jgi:predicted tellurium resistance membrane protein TerC
MEWLTDPHAWMALATLTALEIVLGVDNIIFISILCGRLPRHQQARARTLGLAFAMLTRLGLLFSLTWLMTLTAPLFTLAGKEVSGRDLILIAGGFFLLWKAVHEIHGALEGDEDDASVARAASFGAVIAQIAIIDIVFSLDSVITAVGLVDELEIMAIAIILAVGVMMFAAGPISRFVDEHPTIKMLALTFLTLIGIALIGEGWDLHIPKGYIYFAMAFSVAVEMLNLRMRSRMKSVQLRKRGPRH